MKLLNKMIEYRDFTKSFPIRMAAEVLADLGDSVMAMNEEGTVLVLKKSRFSLVRAA